MLTNQVRVSPVRSRVGRIVLGTIGLAAVGMGAVGAAGLHSTSSRVLAAAAGLALVVHGLGLVRMARNEAASRSEQSGNLR